MIKRALLIANVKSGRGNASELPKIAQEICDELGYQLVIYPTEGKETWDGVIAQAVKAAADPGSVLIAAGGDGTIRSVAQAAAETGVKFAVVPTGTFNFFARTYSIPENPRDAFRLALTGKSRAVRLGRINDQYFLVNASLGSYAQSIAEREKNTKRFGRHQLVVIFSTIRSLLRGKRLLKAAIQMRDKEITERTPTIFIGNNTLQLRNLNFPVARCMEVDCLALVMIKPLSWLGMLKLILFTLLGRARKENLHSYCVKGLTIETARQSHEVALDGEIFHLSDPLRVQSVERALELVVGADEVK